MYVFIISALVVFSLFSYAYAATPNTFISIIRSDTCKITKCVKVADLIKYDNSTQKISGKFVLQGDDYVRVRGMKNAHEYYKIYSGKVFVFVEPDQTTLVRSKVITIENRFDVYALEQDKKKTEIDSLTDVRVLRHGVWVDSRCQKATTNLENLDKVITHLASGCKTDLGNIEKIITKKTELNFCGKECQHQKWLAEAKIKSKKLLLPMKAYRQ